MTSGMRGKYVLSKDYASSGDKETPNSERRREAGVSVKSRIAGIIALSLTLYLALRRRFLRLFFSSLWETDSL